MKTRIVIIVIAIALWLVITPLTSQAQQPQLPILNPANIFTDAVQVVQNLPVLAPDNQGRVLYFRDGANWQGHPYPKDLVRIGDWERRANGTFLLTTEKFYPFMKGQMEPIWEFNPTTGIIGRPETACGVVKALPGEGEWVFYPNEYDKPPYRLCFTENGQLSLQLPDKIQANLCGNIWGGLSRRETGLSPDKKWVVFFDCKFEHFSVYSYEVATEQITYLGTNPYGDDEHIDIVRWADNTHPIIFSQMSQENSTRSLFVAGVTRANSLQTIVSHLVPSRNVLAVYDDRPSRFLWIPGTFSFVQPPEEGQEPSQEWKDVCHVHEFNLQTLQSTIYRHDIPDVCGLGVAIPDGTGDRLYRSAPGFEKPDISEPATLIRFNFQTGKSQKLLTGGIQWINSVSPGGSYAELLLDDNWQPISDESVLDWRGSDIETMELPTPRLGILDLKTGKLVYEVFLDLSSENDTGSFLAPRLGWLDDNTFVLVNSSAFESYEYLHLDFGNGTLTASATVSRRILRVESGRITEIPVRPPQILLFSKQRVVTQSTSTIWMPTIGWYDPITKHVISITRPQDIGKYRLSLEQHDDGLIDVIVMDEQHSKDYQEPPFMLGHWLIRIPTGEF